MEMEALRNQLFNLLLLFKIIYRNLSINSVRINYFPVVLFIFSYYIGHSPLLNV